MGLEYTKELYEEHNSYPLAQEKKVMKKELISDCQKALIDDLKLEPPNSEKLVLTLEDRK